MKVKQLLLTSLACCSMLLSSSAANAEDKITLYDGTVVNVPECKDYFSSSWRQNWFIQVGAGVNWSFFEYFNPVNANPTVGNKSNSAKHYHQLSLMVGAGHWFNPYLAVRANIYGGQYKWMNDRFIPVLQEEGLTTPDGPGNYSYAKFVSGNVDIMWDMFNSFHGVNTKRVFSILPFVGFGAQYTWNIRSLSANIPNHAGSKSDNYIKTEEGTYYHKDQTYSIPVYLGAQLRFRLHRNVDLFAEYRAQILPDGANGTAYGKTVDVNMAVMGGLSFNIGERTFETMNPCTYTDFIKDKNDKVNKLRDELADVNGKLAACEAQLPCPAITPCPKGAVPALGAVRFDKKSAKISEYELLNVYSMAKYMDAHKDVKIVVTGYADDGEGNVNVQQKISEARAKAVYEQLLQYGADPNQVTYVGKGSEAAPYKNKKEWNYVVIFNSILEDE